MTLALDPVAAVGGEPAQRANRVPTSTAMRTSLVEDTVADAAVSAAGGPRSVALYADPFREGAEGVVLVDASRRLTSLHKPDGAAGWRQDDLGGQSCVEVVSAVHLDGTPWCFAVADDGTLRALRLQPDSTWAPGVVSAKPSGWANLTVQYRVDRPATACVF